MSHPRIVPYLFFDGTAERAIELYQRALGATVETLSRYADAPADVEGCGDADAQPAGPIDPQRIMHASLQVGGARLMASDSPDGRPSDPGSQVHVCLDFDDADAMQRSFDTLAEGGRVTSPLQDTFWGARFGTLTDAFGIRWMFNCTHAPG